jgi:hypothetical protein
MQMAVTDKPWDGSASRYKDTDAYCAACLIDSNEAGKDKIQANCKLPMKEPNGDINKNALGAALAALNGARGGLKGVSPQDRKSAAKKLLSAYREAKLAIPDSLKNMAS